MSNADLKQKYDEMHKEGPTAWTSTGWNERMLILGMMESWEGLAILEIGCGEGDLAAMMAMAGADVMGCDYSEEATNRARQKHPDIPFWPLDYRDISSDSKQDLLIMQGVLEHLDKPFEELKWMLDNLVHDEGTIITTSPGFLNMRGMWWMFCKYILNVPVSLTDLHEINPWQMDEFAIKHGLGIFRAETDHGWGWGSEMIKDFNKRIPAACKGHNYTYSDIGFKKFMKWLEKAIEYTHTQENCMGATIGYKLWK